MLFNNSLSTFFIAIFFNYHLIDENVRIITDAFSLSSGVTTFKKITTTGGRTYSFEKRRHYFSPSSLYMSSSTEDIIKDDINSKRADDIIRNLWGNNEDFSIKKIVAACSNDIVWEDFRLIGSPPAKGKDEVLKLLESQIPEGTTFTVDRYADGKESAGFTWTRGTREDSGLRGTTYIRLNENGEIGCVKELAEPLYKPGDMMLQLLQAATKDVPRPPKNPTYVSETPTTCRDIVDYIWNRAYPKDAPVEEALKFYSPNIVYQDFNYNDPIVGFDDVAKFSREWGDFPGIDFRIQDLSQGDKACVFTWRVKVNGQEGPQGISFYETDGNGKLIYIRDTPSPSFTPILGNLASLLRPKLGVFQSRTDLIGGIPKEVVDTM